MAHPPPNPLPSLPILHYHRPHPHARLWNLAGWLLTAVGILLDAFVLVVFLGGLSEQLDRTHPLPPGDLYGGLAVAAALLLAGVAAIVAGQTLRRGGRAAALLALLLALAFTLGSIALLVAALYNQLAHPRFYDTFWTLFNLGAIALAAALTLGTGWLTLFLWKLYRNPTPTTD